MTPDRLLTRAAGPWGLVALWACVAGLLLAVMAPALPHYGAHDPDDYMRLAQVRDWLAGQGWFDVRQYRMDPPLGADMHWSRLVDLPIAGFLAMFRLFLAEPAATAAAMTAVPLLQLLLVMVLVRCLLLTLGQSALAANAGAALVLLFPILIGQFLPLRIDHHGWQGIAALASALMLARGDSCRSPALAGLIGAAWLSVSLEGLPLVGLVAAVFALRYLTVRDHAAASYLVALAGGSLLLFAATRPLAAVWHPVCDAVSWPHIAAFAAAGCLTALMSRLPWQDSLAARCAALALCGMAAGGVLILALGACATDPFGAIDPVVRRAWLAHVSEGLPVTAQDPSVAVMLVWTLVLAVAGWLAAAHTARTAGRPAHRWHELGLLAVAAALLSLALMRAALAAQMLALPLVATMIAQILPRIRAVPALLPRVFGTAAFLLCATPLAAVILGTLAERVAHPQAPRRDVRAQAAHHQTRCAIAALNALPRTRLFALLDMGPEVLARTPHAVEMGPYHRNDAAIRRVLEVFGGDPARAEALVRASSASHVAFCPRLPEAAVAAARRKDGLAAQLLADKPPRWLRRVPLREPGIAVYAIVR